MTKETDYGGWRVAHRYAQNALSDVARASKQSHRNEKTLGLFPSALRKVREFSYSSSSCRRALTTSGWFCRKWASISPWVLGFCAVFGGGCLLSASPTWGNVGAGWRFGPIRPAKPPRSCKRGSLALKMARLDVCLGLVDAGRHPRMNKAFEARRRPEVSKIQINTHIKLTSVSRYYKVTAG